MPSKKEGKHKNYVIAFGHDMNRSKAKAYDYLYHEDKTLDKDESQEDMYKDINRFVSRRNDVY